MRGDSGAKLSPFPVWLHCSVLNTLSISNNASKSEITLNAEPSKESLVIPRSSLRYSRMLWLVPSEAKFLVRQCINLPIKAQVEAQGSLKLPVTQCGPVVVLVA